MAKKENKSSSLTVELPERVDTFNQAEILALIGQALEKSSQEVVVDLSKNRFLSLPFIKNLAALAEGALSAQKNLVLLNATEKIKKQIGIFAKLESFTLRRAFLKPEWPLLDGNADF